MTDMTTVIDRNPADIDPHLRGIQGDKRFFLFGLGIIDSEDISKKLQYFPVKPVRNCHYPDSAGQNVYLGLRGLWDKIFFFKSYLL